MTILEHISQMKLGVLDRAFDGWTDERTVGRGYGYVDNVIELAATENLLAGVVDGTTRYYTNVRLEKDGELEAICSCPVGKRCKHSVALILKAQQMLFTQVQVPSTIPEEWITRPQERAREVERMREEKLRQQRLETEKRAAEQAYEEECGRKREDAFWRDFSAVREAVLALCRNDSFEKIKAAAETFLEWADDDELYQHPQLSQKVWGAVNPTMDVVLETFEVNGVDPADTIIWAYELTAPDRGLSIGDRLEALKSSPAGQYAHAMIWEEVAHRIQGKLDEIPVSDYSVGDCHSRPWYWVEALCAAWERAGNVEKVTDCYLKFVSRIGNWREVAHYLNRHQLYDKAIEIVREGVKVCLDSGEYDNDYDAQLQDPLADAFSGKGDHMKAAAILAEDFLANGTAEKYRKTLIEADKAGVREEVRKGLIHALETGRNPAGIITFKFQPAKQEFEWRPVPKPVVYRIKLTSPETPPWPLPWANEGIRLFDSRWTDFKSSCQSDMEFLLKLALLDGDEAEIARRFDDLPETPYNGGMPLEGAQAEMCEMVMAAMKGYRDDIVQRLSTKRKSCYVREDRNGVKCAVRVIKRLGENSDDTFLDWPTAMGSWK